MSFIFESSEKFVNSRNIKYYSFSLNSNNEIIKFKCSESKIGRTIKYTPTLSENSCGT